MESLQFSVNWSSYHSNISHGFAILQQREEFVDMTLAADGHFVKVHRSLVCLVSPFIKELVMSMPGPAQHPVIFLDISYDILCYILEYIYKGELFVPNEKFDKFLTCARKLHIRGLENLNKINNTETENEHTDLEVNHQYPSDSQYNPQNILENQHDAQNEEQCLPVEQDNVQVNLKHVQDDQKHVTMNQEHVQVSQKVVPEGQKHDQELVPIDQELVPANQEHILAHQELLPVDKEYMIANQELLQADQEYVPLNQQSVPPNQQVVLVNQQHAPLNQQHVPINQQHEQADQQHEPVGQEHVQANQQHVPVDQDHVPAIQNYLKINQEHVQGNQKVVSADQEYVPINQELVPADQPFVPSDQQYVPPDQQVVPADQQHVPVNGIDVTKNAMDDITSTQKTKTKRHSIRIIKEKVYVRGVKDKNSKNKSKTPTKEKKRKLERTDKVVIVSAKKPKTAAQIMKEAAAKRQLINAPGIEADMKKIKPTSAFQMAFQDAIAKTYLNDITDDILCPERDFQESETISEISENFQTVIQPYNQSLIDMDYSPTPDDQGIPLEIINHGCQNFTDINNSVNPTNQTGTNLTTVQQNYDNINQNFQPARAISKLEIIAQQTKNATNIDFSSNQETQDFLKTNFTIELLPTDKGSNIDETSRVSYSVLDTQGENLRDLLQQTQQNSDFVQTFGTQHTMDIAHIELQSTLVDVQNFKPHTQDIGDVAITQAANGPVTHTNLAQINLQVLPFSNMAASIETGNSGQYAKQMPISIPHLKQGPVAANIHELLQQTQDSIMADEAIPQEYEIPTKEPQHEPFLPHLRAVPSLMKMQDSMKEDTCTTRTTEQSDMPHIDLTHVDIGCTKDINPLLYTTSQQGRLQLIFNRYLYHLQNYGKKKRRRWRCVDYKGKRCRALVDTYDDGTTKRTNGHCHDFHDSRIHSKVMKNLTYTSLEEATTQSYNLKRVGDAPVSDEEDDYWNGQRTVDVVPHLAR